MRGERERGRNRDRDRDRERWGGGEERVKKENINFESKVVKYILNVLMRMHN